MLTLLPSGYIVYGSGVVSNILFLGIPGRLRTEKLSKFTQDPQVLLVNQTRVRPHKEGCSQETRCENSSSLWQNHRLPLWAPQCFISQTLSCQRTPKVDSLTPASWQGGQGTSSDARPVWVETMTSLLVVQPYSNASLDLRNRNSHFYPLVFLWVFATANKAARSLTSFGWSQGSSSTAEAVARWQSACLACVRPRV